MEQDAHAREAIGITNQPNDLEQHLPLQPGGKCLGKLLQPSGLIANALAGETQDLPFEGIKFFGGEVRENVLESRRRSSLRREELQRPPPRKPGSPDYEPPPQK